MTQSKGKSPFYPGQPVPIELFTGRSDEIQRILRALSQVELGKPQSVFVQGEYGIGKSSLAGLMRFMAERDKKLAGIHVFLGGAESIEDVASKTVEAIVRSTQYRESASEKIRNFLSRYVGKPELFGISVDFERLKADSPNIAKGFLPFLREFYGRLQDGNFRGIMLILDEINGITANRHFAHFIKALVDENALSEKPLPLLLMLCGVEDRRRELIEHHQPIERIFEIINVSPMNDEEIDDFYVKSFESVNITVDQGALTLLRRYSAGFPKIMHVIGDATFWIDADGKIDEHDAYAGIFEAAEEIGRKFVDQQVYKALRSRDYRSILKKLAKEKFDLAFHKARIEKGLSETELKKLNNFLQRMKKLNVLKAGDERGEYVFTSRLVRLYLQLRALE